MVTLTFFIWYIITDGDIVKQKKIVNILGFPSQKSPNSAKQKKYNVNIFIISVIFLKLS